MSTFYVDSEIEQQLVAILGIDAESPNKRAVAKRVNKVLHPHNGMLVGVSADNAYQLWLTAPEGSDGAVEMQEYCCTDESYEGIQPTCKTEGGLFQYLYDEVGTDYELLHLLLELIDLES